MVIGAWAKPKIIGPFARGGYDIAPGVLFSEAHDGYLLGAKTLGQEVPYLEGLFRQCRVPCPERRLERPTLGVIATPLAVGA